MVGGRAGTGVGLAEGWGVQRWGAQWLALLPEGKLSSVGPRWGQGAVHGGTMAMALTSHVPFQGSPSALGLSFPFYVKGRLTLSCHFSWERSVLPTYKWDQELCAQVAHPTPCLGVAPRGAFIPFSNCQLGSRTFPRTRTSEQGPLGTTSESRTRQACGQGQLRHRAPAVELPASASSL